MKLFKMYKKQFLMFFLACSIYEINAGCGDLLVSMRDGVQLMQRAVYKRLQCFKGKGFEYCAIGFVGGLLLAGGVSFLERRTFGRWNKKGRDELLDFCKQVISSERLAGKPVRR
jgi:hypothetical protein